MTQKRLEKSIPYRESLQKYFGVEDLTPYKNIPLNTMDFFGRTFNCFERWEIKTLADLLPYSRKDFEEMKGFGSITVDNIIKYLRKFFYKRYTESPVFEKEPLDKSLILDALNGNPYIKTIIYMMKIFSSKVKSDPPDDDIELYKSEPPRPKLLIKKNKKNPKRFVQSVNHTCDKVTEDNETLKEMAIEKLNSLRAKYENKNLQPFINAYNSNHDALPEDIAHNSTVDELIAYVTNPPCEIDFKAAKNFSYWLDFDLNNLLASLIKKIFVKERDIDVLMERMAGNSLKKVGLKFNTSNESIRQIEFKIVQRFFNAYQALPQNIFFCLYALNGGKNILYLDDAKKFIDEYNFKIFRHILKNIQYGKDFSYDEEINAIIFYSSVVLKDIDLEELKKSLPSKVLKENEFNEFIKNFAAEKNYPLELLNLKLHDQYTKYGNYIFLNEISLHQKYDFIFKKYFPNGYKISNIDDYKLFKSSYKEIFNTNETASQKTLDVRLANIGVLCGRGRYIHKSYVKVPKETLKLIKNFVDSSTRNVFSYKEIFTVFKDKLLESNIINHYFLQGIIKLYRLPYIFKKDYLLKIDGAKIESELDEFVEQRGEVTLKEIKNEFNSLPAYNIGFIFGRCHEIIKIGVGTFMHSNQLNLIEKESAEIENFLLQACEKKSMHMRIIFDLIKENFPNFISRNKIGNFEKLFGILKYMFNCKLTFIAPYISLNTVSTNSGVEILLRYLKNVDSAYISELLRVCENHGMLWTSSYLVETLNKYFIRVNETTLRSIKSIGVTDEIISAVHNALKTEIENNGGWFAAKNFKNYNDLPKLKIEWTDYLLESIESLHEEKFGVLKIHALSTGCTNAVFVSDKFADDDIKSFTRKVLIAENKRRNFKTKDEIFDWMNGQGLCHTKLPAFIFTEGYIDKNGNVSLP